MRNTIILCVLIAAMAVGGAWLYTQPSKAFQAVQLAMDRDDPSLLAPWLDAQALRSNLKNREAAKLPGALQPGAPGSGNQPGLPGIFGMLGQALADSVLGAITQNLATPEGVLALLRGAAAGAQTPEGKTPRTPSERLFAQVSTELLGFDRYVVSAQFRPNAVLQLVFTRQGTKWLLSDIEVKPVAPPNA